MKSVNYRLKTLSIFSRALGNPTRIAILEYIANNKEKTCFSELTQQLEIPKATCSQHLKYLEKSKLIKVTTNESRPYYTIDENNWSRYKAYFEIFISNCPCYRNFGRECTPCCPELSDSCCGNPLPDDDHRTCGCSGGCSDDCDCDCC